MDQRRLDQAAARGLRTLAGPALKRRIAPTITAEAQFAALKPVWDSGAPNFAVALHLGWALTTLTKRLTALRKAGFDIAYRGNTWKAPADWKQRLDDLRAEEE
jgi:hypothetical protein